MAHASDRESPSALARLADEDLMELVPTGHAAAFELVYDRHATAAFSLAYRMCGNRGRAEDVVQEAFISVWRSGARYDRTRGSVRNWLLGIVHNRAIDALRRGGTYQRHIDGDETAAEKLDAGDRTDDEVLRRDDARQLRSLLETLPPDQSKVIELAYFGGFTHTEIAEMLDTPVGTIKGRMRLGLAKMRAGLGDPAAVMT